jgi:signal transduction histidine kinase
LHDERSAVQGNGYLSVQICRAKTLMLAGLIDQLSLAVGPVAGAPNDWHVIDVPTWLRHLSNEIAGALAATGHRLLVEANRGPAEALVNPGLLQAAVLNLLDNAQKHSPAGALIVLSTTCASEWVMVQISDRGPGLPAGLVPALFSRIDNPFTFDLPGLGLGLTIAANVAQTLGGELRHARRQGGGCVFILVLPRRASDVRR